MIKKQVADHFTKTTYGVNNPKTSRGTLEVSSSKLGFKNLFDKVIRHSR